MNRSAEYNNTLLIECVRAYLTERPFSPSGEIDWCALLERAYRHKIAPVVWGVMAQQPEMMPPEIWAAFTIWMEHRRRKSGCFALHLRRLSGLLSDAGIPALTLKGIALALGEYGSISMRQFEDIDLLIPPEHIHHTLRLVQEQGFIFTDEKQQALAFSALPADDYHFQLQHQRWLISLELHWKVGWRHYNARDFPLSFAELAADARELRLLDSTIRTPSPLHTVILLGVESFKDSRITLGRLLEVALITRQPTFDWDALWSNAERVRALNETAALVGAAATLFDLPDTSALAIAHQRPVVSEVIQKFLRDVQTEQIPTTLEYLHLIWQLRGAQDEKLLFARQLIGRREYWAYFAPRIAWDLLLMSARGLRLSGLPGSKRLAFAFRPLKLRARLRFRQRW